MSWEQPPELKQKTRNEYHRKWIRDNPGKAAQIQSRYWQKKAAELRSTEQKEGEKDNVQ